MRKAKQQKNKTTMKDLIIKNHWSVQGLIKALGLSEKDIRKWVK